MSSTNNNVEPPKKVKKTLNMFEKLNKESRYSG